MYTDKTLQCAGCGSDFVFSADEQEFFATKGFQEPRRCKPCRDAAKQSRRGGDGGFNRPQREWHDVVCEGCGIQTQVPFKPDGLKPVYCRDCYAIKRM